MRLLLDINVLVDLLQHRGAFAIPAAKLFGAIEMKRVTGYVAGHTITTAYYYFAAESPLPSRNPRS